MPTLPLRWQLFLDAGKILACVLICEVIWLGAMLAGINRDLHAINASLRVSCDRLHAINEQIRADIERDREMGRKVDRVHQVIVGDGNR